MSSPFPGIDPYIEAQNRWSDFHHEFISQCRALIHAHLPEDYVATINERVQTIDLAESRPHAALPDVALARERRASSDASGGAAIATLAPQVLTQAVEWLDEPTEGYIEIFHLPSYRLVTGIEVLSPSNKVNPGRVAYLAKRRDLLHHGVNLVEIDLLLAGERLSMLEPLPSGDYYTFITRCPGHDRCDVYSWSVRQPLPTIPVPLRSGDSDVPLDLAAAFRATYDVGRYRRILRYGRPLALPLSTGDAEWSAQRGAERDAESREDH